MKKLSILLLFVNAICLFAQESDIETIKINFADRETMIDQLVDLPECIDHIPNIFNQMEEHYIQVEKDLHYITDSLKNLKNKMGSDFCQNTALNQVSDVLDQVANQYNTVWDGKITSLYTFYDNLDIAYEFIKEHIQGTTTTDEFMSNINSFINDEYSELVFKEQDEVGYITALNTAIANAKSIHDRRFANFSKAYIQSQNTLAGFSNGVLSQTNNAYNQHIQVKGEFFDSYKKCIDTYNFRIEK